MAVQIKNVAPETYLLDCGKDPFFSTSNIAYYLDDDMPVLVDPRSGTAAAELLAGAGQAGIDLQRLSYIIPTHIHLDHGGGAGHLAQRLPKPKVVLHPKGATHLVDTSVLIQPLLEALL